MAIEAGGGVASKTAAPITPAMRSFIKHLGYGIGYMISCNAMIDLLEQIAGATEVSKRAISAPDVLNEAYDYPKPSSFSRAMRIDLGRVAIILISGTASIDERGNSVHIGDFRGQLRRTYSNITGLLEAEGASWKDVVRTTCYLRDIERDYPAFNEERTAFFREQGLDPLPASTGIQAVLCRPELLIEIEAIAILAGSQ